MTYDSGTEIIIEVEYKDRQFNYRAKTTSPSIDSPVKYIGNISNGDLKGEIFMYCSETNTIVVEIPTISSIKNKILDKNYDIDTSLEVSGKIIAYLDLECFYKQVEKKFNSEFIKNAEHKINVKLDYISKYDAEVVKNKKYKALIKKYIKVKSDLQDLQEEFEKID